jgi:hypothetical protein
MATNVEIKSEGEPKPNIDAEMIEGSEISGTVTSATTHAGLNRTQVCAETELASEPVYDCVTTNESGEYRIVGLADAEYLLVFYPQESCKGPICEPLNYITQFYNGAIEPGAAEYFDIAKAGETYSGKNAAMEEGARITGKVTIAAGGAPAQGIEVCAETSKQYYASCGYTNAQGEYTIQGLASGSYAIEIAGSVICGEGGCKRTTYLNEYYNNEFSLASANFVSVTAPSTLTGINAELVESKTQIAEEESLAKIRREEAAARKHAEELATAKKHEEETLLANEHTEQAALLAHEAEVRDTSVRIEKVRVASTRIYITVNASRAGLLTITGSGLKKTIVHLSAGTHRVKVMLTRAGVRDLARHKKIKVTLGFSAGTVTLQELKSVRL